MHRRNLLSAAAVSVAAATLPAPGTARRRTGEPFALDFAPHFGMFRHHAGDDLVDQLKFMHDEGFRSLEDNGLAGRSSEDQERVARALGDLGMRMGVFVAHAQFGAVSFASDSPAAKDAIRADIERSVEVAGRVGARWCTVVPGAYRQDREWDYQTATVIDNLRMAAEICEPHGLVLVLEPLNPWRDHPGLFLTKVPQAYLICRAVDSPAVKILDDLYHQQITEGNLIPNLDRAWSEIAYIQVGDHPGRKEPGTGEIHYGNVFRHLKSKGFDGIVGMEHGNSQSGREGERAVIDAYRTADPR